MFCCKICRKDCGGRG